MDDKEIMSNDELIELIRGLEAYYGCKFTKEFLQSLINDYFRKLREKT